MAEKSIIKTNGFADGHQKAISSNDNDHIYRNARVELRGESHICLTMTMVAQRTKVAQRKKSYT